MIQLSSCLQCAKMLTPPSYFLLLLACATTTLVQVSSIPLVGPAAIRPLVCINKVTNQSGVCMFTMDCIAMNGTALGVCGDRFYFGSCCVVPALDEELNALERTGPTYKRRQQVSATHLLEMRDHRSLWPSSSSEEIQDEEIY